MAGLQLYCSYCEEGTFIEPKEDSPCLFYEHFSLDKLSALDLTEPVELIT